MLRIALKNWWMLTVKGIITFIFGIVALTLPLETLVFISRFFGLLVLASGLTLVIFSLTRKTTYDRSWKLTEGFIDITIGAVVLSYVSITSSILIALIAIWISFMGILQISNGYRLKSLYNHWWFLILNGILAIAFAVLIFTQPAHGIFTLAVLIGLQAVVFGGFLIVSSIYVKKMLHDISLEIPQKEGDEGNQELSYY